MILSRFCVQATTGIGDLDLKLCHEDGRPFERTVVFGRNGSGKSRLAQILTALYRVPLSFSRPEGLEEVGYATAWVDLDTVLYPPHLRPSDFRPVALSCGDRLRSVPSDSTDEIAAFWTEADGTTRTEMTPKGRSRSLGAAVAKMRQGMMDGRGGLLFYPQQRDLGKLRFEGIKPEETTFEWIWEYRTRSSWSGSVEAWLVWQNYLDMEELGCGAPAQRADRFGKVARLVNRALKGVEMVGVNRGRVVASACGDPGRTFPMEDLSAGERQVILLLADAARRLRPGALLLIDCPELYLSEDGQDRLLGALDGICRERTAQLLVMTVSERTRDWFKENERFELGRAAASEAGEDASARASS